MTIKDQWIKVKENWIIIAAVFALLLFMNIGGVQEISYSTQDSLSRDMMSPSYDSSKEMSYGGSGYMPSPNSDFAPDVEERKITRTASLSTEVERGEFKSAEQNLKNIISSTDSFIINENVYKYGTDKKEYHQGSYNIKVDTTKYEALVSQIKNIGEVKSFSENANDVTGQYTNAAINLETERARLERYEEMYDEAVDVEDKLNINDRIFDQERRIKYLEDSIKNIDQRIDYTTIYFSMTEKRSGYADIAFVKLSSLIKKFIDSVNTLLVFIFTIVPWAVVVLIGIVVWRIVRKR